MSPSPVPLTALAVGRSATIVDIHVPSDVRNRLLELGLVAGTPVQLVRFAPLGDPVEIHFRGSNLTLRRHEAEQVMVEPAG
jgi:ferrous iron transport protein A